MRRLSKAILLGESVLLAYLTFLGVLLSLGALVPLRLDTLAVAGLVVLLALASGWRLMAWVLADGPAKGTSVNPIWWLGAGLGVAVTLLSAASHFALIPFAFPSADLFVLGLYFTPSLIHVLLEAWAQQRANNSFKPNRLRRSA